MPCSFFGAFCARFLLGFVEASFFPGALVWIRTNNMSTKINLFSFLFLGGINEMNSPREPPFYTVEVWSAMHLAPFSHQQFLMWWMEFSVLQHGGKRSQPPLFVRWMKTYFRWLFFVEGALTIVVAIGAIFILPDFPESDAGWLTLAERTLAHRRMVNDAVMDDFELWGTDSHSTKTKDIFMGLVMALQDWKVWWLFVATASMTVSLSFNVFFPTLSATMGYSRTVTLLLCAPPWVFATAAAFFGSRYVLSRTVGIRLEICTTGRHSDQSGERCWHITIPSLIGILGFLLAMSTMNTAARYFSLWASKDLSYLWLTWRPWPSFLMAQSYTACICFLAWASGTISHPSSKRAVALAIINCGSTVGNIAGS